MIDQQAYFIGETIANCVYDYFNGEEIEAYDYVPVELVTRETYDTWLEKNKEYTD